MVAQNDNAVGKGMSNTDSDCPKWVLPHCVSATLYFIKLQ